jgi:phytoene dehydrogenase-like protein
MSSKKVIIVGAGMAGLSTGVYLQMNGYDTEIFEMHSIAGGLCTGWKRKGYTFDGCIHWLCGSRQGSEMYTIWKELGLIQDKKIVDHEIFIHSDLGDGKSFSVFVDPDKFKEELLKYGLEDKEIIEDITYGIKVFGKVDMPALKPQDMFSLADGLKFGLKAFPLLKVMKKFGKLSLNDVQSKFKSAFLQNNFVRLTGMHGEMPVTALLYTLGLLSIKSAGYPIGGSLGMVKSVEDKYLSLGGKVYYNSKVEEIIVEADSAKGIKLANGSEHYADIVVSGCDGHYTIYNMLKGKYLNDEIEGYYKNFKLFPSIIQVSLGIAREFKDMPDAVTYNLSLDEPINVDGKNRLEKLGLKVYNYDPTFSPKGKTVVSTFFEADHEYWINLRKDNPEKYAAEKERIAQEVIDRLDRKLGGIKGKVEVWDVATPYTFVRYTNNWKASFEGFLPTVENFSMNIKKTLPGLNNFHMVGQWVQPGGGLPPAGMHGRYLALKLCKMDGKKFVVK